MKRAWLTWLTSLLAMLAAVLMALLAAPPAQAMPIPFAEREVQLTAREQPIAAFLQDLFGLVDVPVSVSPSVKGAVNGSFAGPAARVWRNIARAFNLVEYYDGAVLHIYSPADMVTRTLPVAPSLAARVQRNVLEMRLPDARNTLRSTEDGTLIVSGTRRFIEQVEEITRAQLVSDRTGPPSGFKVFYLRYAWAQDVSISFGGRQVVLPGVASIVRALMTSQSRSQVAVQSNETPAAGTVPGLRGLRGQRPAGDGTRGGMGTLGGAQADAGAPSWPVLAAAYGAGGAQPPAGAAGQGGGSALAPLMPQALSLGDASMVRVEADARLNAVIVRDAPDRLAQYEQLVAALDIEPQTLEIEATIIDVNTERLKELGINWRYSRGRSSLLFGRGDSSDLGLAPGTAPADITPIGRGGFVSAVLGDAREFIARVNLLEDQGAARVVSSPQVLTLSNVEAVFDNSSTFYVRVAGREDVDLFNVSAGTTLRVTPHVFKDAGEVRIKMLVAIEDGTLSSTRVVDTLPVVERSSVNTQALIFEGESLLVGGITREASNDGVTKVPGLGDVPVLGNLFRNSSQGSSRVERMFLISPRLSSGRQPRAAAAPAAALPAPVPPPASAPIEPQVPAPAPAPAAPSLPFQR